MVDRVLLSSDSKNCKEDVDKFLFNLKSFSKMQSLHSTDASTTETNTDNTNTEALKSLMTSFRADSVMSLEEENVLTYIAGYICRKLKSKICEQCYKDLTSTLDVGNLSHTFISKKQYEDTPCNLTFQVIY